VSGVARAIAHANIALVKYWGKRDAELNLPATGSLGLTLAALSTTTEVRFGSERDRFFLGGAEIGGAGLARLTRWLDLVRARAGIASGAEVRSENNFPTASGLASSASAYAALAVAATAAAGLELAPDELSALARRGSGSAARSVLGGLVQMRAGSATDGSDSFAKAVADPRGLTGELAMVIAIVGGGRVKAISSRDAMEHCASTSPLYRGWLEAVGTDLAGARGAIERGDLEALGEIAEASALAMHAAAIASRPAILYFQPATVALIDRVRALRRHDGLSAFFTIDAGPHVKVLTRMAEAGEVAAALREVEGVTDIAVSEPGGPARLIPRAPS
jgi:diphosphomevalonate decarboxylase